MKSRTPYILKTENGKTWIVDQHGADVLTNVTMSIFYANVFEAEIMRIICDALNYEEAMIQEALDEKQP
jgi:hypothetical protein